MRMPVVSDAASFIVRRPRSDQLIIEEEVARFEGSRSTNETRVDIIGKQTESALLETEGHDVFLPIRRTVSADHGSIGRKEGCGIQKAKSRDMVAAASQSQEEWILHLEAMAEGLATSLWQRKERALDGYPSGVIALPSSEKLESGTESPKKRQSVCRLHTILARNKGKILQNSFGRFKLCLINDIPCFALDDVARTRPSSNLTIAVQCVNNFMGRGSLPDAVDVWLKAALSSSSHVAICYTDPADIRLARMIDRDHVLSQANEIGLSATSVPFLESQMATGLRLLEFLSTNCDCSKRYWLYRSHNAASAVLVDLDEVEDYAAVEVSTTHKTVSGSRGAVVGASISLNLAIRSRLSRQASQSETIHEILGIERILLSRALQGLEGYRGRQKTPLDSALRAAAVQVCLDELNLLRTPQLNQIGGWGFREWSEKGSPQGYSKIATSLEEAIGLVRDMVIDSEDTESKCDIGFCAEFRAQLDEVFCDFMNHIRNRPLMKLIGQSLENRQEKIQRTSAVQDCVEVATAGQDISLIMTQVLSLFCTIRLINLFRCLSSVAACHCGLSVAPIHSRTVHFTLQNFLNELIDMGLFYIVLKSVVPAFDINECLKAFIDPATLEGCFDSVLKESRSDTVEFLSHMCALLHPASLSYYDRCAGLKEVLTFADTFKSVVQWNDIWSLNLRKVWLTFSSVGFCGESGDVSHHQTFELFASLLCEWSNREILGESTWDTHRAWRLTLCFARYIVAMAFTLLRGDHLSLSALLCNLSLLLQLLSSQYKISLCSETEKLATLFTQEQYDAYRSAGVCCALGEMLSGKKIVETPLNHKETVSLIRRCTRGMPSGDDRTESRQHEDLETVGAEQRRWVETSCPLITVHETLVEASLTYRLKLKGAYHTLATGVDLVQYLPYQEALFPNHQLTFNMNAARAVADASTRLPYWNQVKIFVDFFIKTTGEPEFREEQASKGTVSARKKRSLKAVVNFVSSLLSPCLLMHFIGDVERTSMNDSCADAMPAALLSLISQAKLHEASDVLLEGNAIMCSGESISKLAVKHLLASVDMFRSLKNSKEQAVAHYYLGRVYQYQAVQEKETGEGATRKWARAIKHFQCALDEFNPWVCGIDFINSMSRMLELMLMRGTNLKSALALGIAGEAILVSGMVKNKTTWPNSHLSFLTSVATGEFAGVKMMRPWIQKLSLASVKSSALSSTKPSSKSGDGIFTVVNEECFADLLKHCKEQLNNMSHTHLKRLSVVLLKNESPFCSMRIKVI